MTMDGWAHDRWNSNGMFFIESGLAVASGALFLVLARIFLGRRSAVQETQPLV
jgi:hypothetical protein